MRLFLSLFFTISLAVPIHSYSAESEKTIQDEPELISQLDEYQQHLDTLKGILQTAGTILGTSSRSTQDKQLIRDWIIQQTKDIETLKKAVLYNNSEKFTSSLSASYQCLSRIYTAFTSNFSKLLTSPLPALTSITFDAHVCRKQLNTNKQAITLLQTRLSTIDVTPLNRLCRAADSLNHTYNISSRVTTACSMAAIAAVALYLTPKRYLPKTLLPLKESLGPQPVYKHEALQNGDDLRVLGHIDNFIRNFRDFMPAISLFISLNGQWLSRHLATASIRAEQARTQLWKKLRGIHDASQDDQEEITLDDERLIGMESHLNLFKDIAHSITNPEQYTQARTLLKDSILLVGPSRTGKTLLAHALQGTLNSLLRTKNEQIVRFKEVAWHEFFTDFEGGFKKIIKEAQSCAPCILFIDEIHNLPLQTKDMGGKVLTEFLTLLHTINQEGDPYHQVILIAATNRPEFLDPALLQPGRFGRILHFQKPNHTQRERYFTVMLSRMLIDPQEIAIQTLAHETTGCSYGDLDKIIKQTHTIAHIDHRSVTTERLQTSIREHLLGIQHISYATAGEETVVATYRAGQVLINLLLQAEKRLHTVTINGVWKKIYEKHIWDWNQKKIAPSPTTPSYGKIFRCHLNEAVHQETEDDLIKEIVYRLAGTQAEQLLIGHISHDYHPQDLVKARELINKAIYTGLAPEHIDKIHREEKKNELLSLFNACTEQAALLLKEHKEDVEKIRDLLLEKKTVSAQDLIPLVNQSKTLSIPPLLKLH